MHFHWLRAAKEKCNKVSGFCIVCESWAHLRVSRWSRASPGVPARRRWPPLLLTAHRGGVRAAAVDCVVERSESAVIWDGTEKKFQAVCLLLLWLLRSLHASDPWPPLTSTDFMFSTKCFSSKKKNEKCVYIPAKRTEGKEKKKSIFLNMSWCVQPQRTKPWLLDSMRHLVSSLCITQGNECLAVGQEAALWRLAAVAGVGKPILTACFSISNSQAWTCGNSSWKTQPSDK